jgi:D-alanyl-D-alanine carboxypeptidase
MLDGVDMGSDGRYYGLGIAYTRLPCGAEFVGHAGAVRGLLTHTLCG